MLTLDPVMNRLVPYGCRDPCSIRKIAQLSSEQVSVSPQLFPRLVECEVCDLRNGVPALEQSASCFVTQIMERQVPDAKHFARSCECGADTLRFVRENEVARSRLPVGDLPCLRRVLETSVVACLPERVLRIPNQACMMVGVIVAPAQLADFRFAAGRVNGEPHDVGHRNFGTLITPIEILGELIQLLRGGTNLPSRRVTDQLHLIAGHSCLIDDGWVDIGASTAVFGGAKNAADPRQIIAGSWAGRTVSAPRAYVLNEHGWIQSCCAELSNVMPLEILE